MMAQQAIKANNSSKQLSLIALCLGFFMVIIDVTITNVALPSIAEEFATGISELQWIVDSYALTFACLLLLAGSLCDQLGSKIVLQLGVISFALASLGCALAANIPLLIIFRLLQGVAAAMIVPASLSLVNGLYDDKKDQAKAIAIWAAMGGVAAAIGPLLGATLTSALSWRAIFFVNLPIGIIATLLIVKTISEQRHTEKRRFDLAGQILSTVSVAALAYSLIEAGSLGWHSPLILVGLAICLLSLMAFLAIERRIASPMLPLNLFASSVFSTSIIVSTVINIGFYGILFVLPLYFQQIRAYSVLMTGFAILPLVSLAAIASYYSGKVTGAIGPKLPIVIGLTVAAMGFLALLIIQEQTPSFYILIPALAAMGFGCAFAMPAAIAVGINAVSTDHVGIASGALNAIRQIGGLIGVAIFGTMTNQSIDFITGMHHALIVGASVLLCGAVIALIYIRGNCSPPA